MLAHVIEIGRARADRAISTFDAIQPVVQERA
jgi:hypothetical protein